MIFLLFDIRIAYTKFPRKHRLKYLSNGYFYIEIVLNVHSSPFCTRVVPVELYLTIVVEPKYYIVLAFSRHEIIFETLLCLHVVYGYLELPRFFYCLFFLHKHKCNLFRNYKL